VAGNLKGNLVDVGLLEVFQLLMNSKATGVLNIKGKGVSFKIFFDKGNVVSADSGKSSGLDALIDAALLETGYFEFVKGRVDKNNELSKSTESLIAELFQIHEQWKNIKKVFNGGKQAIPALSSAKKSEISLTKEEFKVASRIDGKSSIEEIAEKVKLPVFKTAEIVYRLHEKGLVLPGGVKKREIPVEPVRLKVGLVRNLLEGEDGLWMSRVLGMAPRSLIDEFEDEYVVWIDVEIVGKWEKKLNKKIFSITATTPEFENIVLQISPQISLGDNIVFHEKLAGKLNLKEGDEVEVLPNI
jgi:hypothetical protein